MSSRQLALLGVTVALFSPASVRESAGCTLFYAADGDIVLGGNNEDWHVPLTKIWFIPRREDRHGVAYVTFGDHRAIQGGMNDQGLFFDFYLYHFHNFDNVVVFDLEKELAKGERVVDMPILFPSNSAYERFQRGAATQTRPQPTDVKQRDKAPTKAATGGVTTPDWIITQDAVNDWSVRNVSTGKITKSRDPIADVYGADRWSTASRNRQPMKSPGDVIVMRPGEYPHSRITLTYDVNEGVAHGMKNNDRILPKDVTWGRDPMTVIRAEKPGSVLIRRNPVGGSQTLYLEWAGAIRLEGLTFQGSSPMGIGTENPKASQGEWQGFRDIEFVQCSVRGERDFETNVGPRNKWGMLSYALGRAARGDQTPGFRWSGGATPENADDWDIEGIHLEHAMYHHNVIANSRDAFAMLIEDLRIRWCGRTAFQMVARTGEGADGIGKVVLRNLDIEDVCLEEGGGGSALTFAGNHDGKVLITRDDP